MIVSFFSSCTSEGFFPLNHIRNREHLIFGAMSFVDRILQFHQVEYVEQPDFLSPTVLLSSSTVFSPTVLEKILCTSHNTLWITPQDKVLAYSFVNIFPKNIESIEKYHSDMRREYIEVSDIWADCEHITDLIHLHEEMLSRDLQYMVPKNQQIFIHESAHVEELVFLNTQKGPIFIDEEADVQAFSYISGPTYIGKRAKIQHAKIRSCYIGNECRIGGEVDSSIFMEYSNKAHDGYVGNSYIGTFVNFGALTTTSNLKNNYHPVQYEYLSHKHQTKMLKLGSIIGDFTTLGIGSLLNTGTTIGIGCNLIHQNGFVEKNIPSFTWLSPLSGVRYQWDMFIQDLSHRLSRRSQELSQKLYNQLWEIYQKEL